VGEVNHVFEAKLACSGGFRRAAGRRRQMAFGPVMMRKFWGNSSKRKPN
jgi:hypothetical protein